MWQELGPRLVPAPAIEGEEVVEELTKGANQTTGSIISVFAEADYFILKNLKAGRPVKLPNGWSIKPIGKSDGSIEVRIRLPKDKVEAINAGFRGKWLNAQHIGLSEAEMIDIWNAQHPEDPIETNGSTPTSPDESASPPPSEPTNNSLTENL
jgi:hypothetical protein